MKIEKNVKFDFDDILITPAVKTEISSRSNVSPFDENGNLPLMTAPMDTVIGLDNIDEYTKNGIIPVLPRTITTPNILVKYPLFEDKRFSEFAFVSYGIGELKYLLDNDGTPVSDYVLLDVANGHMQIVYDLAEQFKKRFPNKYIMVGNIANPETYDLFARSGFVDFVRIGIGNGNGCCHEGTKVITENGEKNIEDVNVGDYVLTHKNTYEEVIGTYTKTSNDLITINEKISVTPNHEFYVLNKKYVDVVNDNNIHEYCEWIEAQNLTNEYLLLETTENV